jgi:DNA-binding CsgD family transcriptional regulator
VNGDEFRERWATLTERQRESMLCRFSGGTQSECAHQLFISEQTDKNRITAALKKLDLPGRTHSRSVHAAFLYGLHVASRASENEGESSCNFN